MVAIFVWLACAVALCSCGDIASSASPDGLARTVAPAANIGAAAANPVTVSPLPGTADASPQTQISFLGAPGTQVSDVRVLGSDSGAHGGRVEGYSTGTGASFLPSRPFRAGERVTVRAQVTTGAGAPPRAASTTFTIAHQASVSQKEFPNNPGNPRAIQHYTSAPTLTPSTVQITTAAKPGASPGDLFLAPYQGEGSPGPMISEQNGSLVWFHPLSAGEASTNFQVQQYQGKPVLTWWQGRILEVGFGQGEDVIYDTSYRPVAYIRAGNGYHADLHEIRLTPQGTAWIDAFDPIHMNLSGAGGSSEGVVNDSVIQEIDIKTGLVMWEWHAIGHIALSESHSSVSHGSSPWDYVHINSIDPGPAGPAGGADASGQPGDVLLSSRGTWTLYDVDMHTGGFVWRLGDRHSSFKLGPARASTGSTTPNGSPGG